MKMADRQHNEEMFPNNNVITKYWELYVKYFWDTFGELTLPLLCDDEWFMDVPKRWVDPLNI